MPGSALFLACSPDPCPALDDVRVEVCWFRESSRESVVVLTSRSRGASRCLDIGRQSQRKVGFFLHPLALDVESTPRSTGCGSAVIPSLSDLRISVCRARRFRGFSRHGFAAEKASMLHAGVGAFFPNFFWAGTCVLFRCLASSAACLVNSTGTGITQPASQDAPGIAPPNFIAGTRLRISSLSSRVSCCVFPCFQIIYNSSVKALSQTLCPPVSSTVLLHTL